MLLRAAPRACGARTSIPPRATDLGFIESKHKCGGGGGGRGGGGDSVINQRGERFANSPRIGFNAESSLLQEQPKFQPPILEIYFADEANVGLPPLSHSGPYFPRSGKVLWSLEESNAAPQPNLTQFMCRFRSPRRKHVKATPKDRASGRGLLVFLRGRGSRVTVACHCTGRYQPS